jgi:4'-phosphopantetheinyl transferase
MDQIACLYTKISHQWSEEELTAKLALLPEKLRLEAFRKRQWLDKQLSIAGKLLLLKLTKKMGVNEQFSLAEMKYNEYHRPYFDNSLDFNIAHSGNIVVCCGTIEGKIGIDIEQVKEIDLKAYSDHFTQNEWNDINHSYERSQKFYHYWTRKEAALKAIGTGFHTELSSIDVSGESLEYDGITYYFRKLDIANGYKCHIATTSQNATIDLKHISL